MIQYEEKTKKLPQHVHIGGLLGLKYNNKTLKCLFAFVGFIFLSNEWGNLQSPEFITVLKCITISHIQTLFNGSEGSIYWRSGTGKTVI